MKRKNDFTQEELVLASVFEKPVGFYKENPLPNVFNKIKFNATLYEECSKSNKEFLVKNWDFYLPFAKKDSSSSLSKILSNVMCCKEMGSDYYVHFMNWICRAWIIQSITGAKIFEIDCNGIDDSIITGNQKEETVQEKHLISLCSVGTKN